MNHWSEELSALGACGDAVRWCRTQKSLKAAWKNCTRGDWMLWLIGRTTKSAPWSDERKPLAACAAECAMLAPPCRDDDYELARIWCIDALMRWSEGKADRDEVEAALRAACAAAASAGDAAASAAYAASASAYAADDYAASAASAAYAAYAASASASAAYASNDYSYDTYSAEQQWQLDHVRKKYPLTEL